MCIHMCSCHSKILLGQGLGFMKEGMGDKAAVSHDHKACFASHMH